MSATRGTPASSQIIWLEQRGAALEEANSVQWKALGEWLEKTAWVVKPAQSSELGLHRADVLRRRIEGLVNALHYVLDCVERGDTSDMQPVRAAIASSGLAP